MSRILNRAAAIAVAATVLLTLVSAAGSGAAAQDTRLASRLPADKPANLLPAEMPMAPPLAVPSPAQTLAPAPAAPAATLSDLVDSQRQADDLTPEIKCLATAVYFESRSESLAGQLAVGRVIVARSQSGRFPGSYCGVVYQHAQFSFVHGGGASAGRNAQQWRTAVAIAEIADAGSWQSPVEGALYFHAARVSPSWHRARIAQIDNHIFYR